MNELEYKHFYDHVGELKGWDFSSVKCITEGETWDFYNDVSLRCKKSDALLDIGTGGGEKLLSIANSALFLVGIDISSEMMSDACVNLLSSGISKCALFANGC
jgi:2-polyprenyl-3-methyl-5-hydroxy-6-metoxy-1,4-benzoquinol methylase